MAPSLSKRKKSSESSFHFCISDFPRDILIKIFCKLPTITILYCKLVCREFRNTISDPDFAEAHYNPTTSRLSVVSHNNILWAIKDSLIYFMEGYDKIRITQDKKRQLDYKIDLLRFNVDDVTGRCPFEILNSCRGFLLIRIESANMIYESKLHVYNPLTSEHLKLPCGFKTVWWRIRILGLGFGAITKKYKVVCVRQRRTSCAVKIDVHTVGTNGWRRIEMNKVFCRLHELNPMLGIGNQPLAMNGVMHWTLEYVPKIGCFDIDKEEINTMDMPSFENTDQNIQVNIGMIHGMLSLGILVGKDSNNLQIWVMRKYGEQESWTKYVVLKNRKVANYNLLSNFNPKLVDVRDNGEMVVLPDDRHCRIALYDPKGDGFKWLRKDSFHERKITHTYIPSFLSIRTLINTAKFETTANHVSTQ